MSPYESSLEDSCHTLDDEVTRLNREKDTLEHRLNDAEDLLRWVVTSEVRDPTEVADFGRALGWNTGLLKTIVKHARAFLEAGEVVYNRPANLPVCAQDGIEQDKFGLPCPSCKKPEPDCECAETDEDSVAKAAVR